MKGILKIALVLIAGSVFSQDIHERLKIAGDLYYANPDSSYVLCKEIELELKNSDQKLAIAEAQLCQARYYLLKTRFEESSILLNKAIAVFEEEQSLAKLAKCHSLKAILLGRIANAEQAMFHQRLALKLYKDANDVQGQINVLTNLSLDFIDTRQNDSALVYLSRLKRFKDQMNSTSMYFMHQNFGSYFNNVGDYQPAIEAYEKALAVANNEGMIDSKTTCLMLLSGVYTQLKKYKKSEELLLESIQIAEENKLLHELNEAYIGLITLYEVQGKFKLAFNTEKINDKVEKEIYNLDKINKINEIESRLRLSEKEAIIAQKELDIKNEQLNTVEAQSKVTQLFFVVALFFVIIIFVIIILVRAKKLNVQIKEQKLMLEEKNIEITDSINYAKRIQKAILPSSDYVNKTLGENFIYYRPKDIVAGDFYWVETVPTDNVSEHHEGGDTILFAAADCTGHGVPGAMVSVVCNNALNRSLNEFNLDKPSEILNKTKELVVAEFSKSDENVKDGMDIALCKLDASNGMLEFSGANNPLWVVRTKRHSDAEPAPVNEKEDNEAIQHRYNVFEKDDVELIEIKGDKQPIGKFFKSNPFNNHQLTIQKGDCIYLFSDGFVDQFGGEKGKKFKYKAFRQLLLSIHNLSMIEQKEFIHKVFKDWKGDFEQLDDVCIIGIRV